MITHTIANNVITIRYNGVLVGRVYKNYNQFIYSPLIGNSKYIGTWCKVLEEVKFDVNYIKAIQRELGRL